MINVSKNKSWLFSLWNWPISCILTHGCICLIGMIFLKHKEGTGYPLQYSWSSQVTQMVKNPSAILDTCVRSLDQEDPLEEGMATHSSILAWRIPWTEAPGGLQSMESQRVSHDWLSTAQERYYQVGLLAVWGNFLKSAIVICSFKICTRANIVQLCMEGPVCHWKDFQFSGLVISTLMYSVIYRKWVCL